ncbi:hypothetical protein [Actinacidiphila rubida]|uniref:Uncharacterized protein n=1 Tax=Actinacidiphila rubida TaxID=310780 RepID=A0A1H8TKV3_9ACTN|nr:hypothetical protein [Actinacidiphila rubida]SEO91602.1 hypothetical protein SAMN05216267_105516 [Actinacidiphila rubida]
METTTPLTSAERIHADHTTVKHLGHWTEATAFEIRARRSSVVLDLRSPGIDWQEPVTIRADLSGCVLKLLLPDDVTVDHWDLAWTGRGKVKDAYATPDGGKGARRLVLSGTAADGEIRLHRGGVAQLSAMCSRAYLRDLRRAHRDGDLPTVDDPARAAVR